MSVGRNRNEGWDPDVFPFNLPAIKTLTDLEFHDKVTFLVGENGSGKSTILEAIAIAAGFNAEGGTKNFNFQTTKSHTDLHNYLRLIRAPKREKGGFFLRAESFFNVATSIDNVGAQKSYGGLSLHNMSHGESFLALVENRFSSDSLYFLDEPEAALSPQRQLSLLTYIHQLAQDNCQFIIATHSPIILAYPDAWIYQIDENGLARAQWDDLEHVDVTRSFLKNPEAYLDILCGDDE